MSYLLANHFLDRADETLNLQTEKIPESGWFPDLAKLGPNATVGGFVLVAALVGVLYYILIWRTRFGFDLRASGLNPLAARASGVASNSMIIKGMMLSGAVAGLVGMSSLLGFSHNYGLDFPTGLGFAGITVALLGRNNPLGIAIGALLLGLPRPQLPDPRPRGHRQGDRRDHGGRHRPLGRHRLRAGPAGHRAPAAPAHR